MLRCSLRTQRQAGGHCTSSQALLPRPRVQAASCWELVCEPGAGAEGGPEGAGRPSWGEARKQECGEEVLLPQVLRKDAAR